MPWKQAIALQMAKPADFVQKWANYKGVYMEDKNCQLLFEYLRSILYDPQIKKPDISGLEGSCQRLEEGLETLQEMAEEMLAYSAALSHGDLSEEDPTKENGLCVNLKNLHALLKQLTWQAKQVALGDYSQKVTYPGELSEAFNTIIARLKEQESQLKAEREEIQRQTDILNSYNELLLELTRKQNEWILVVDAETKNLMYCNKRSSKKEEAENMNFCDVCENRLPFRSKILNWGDERKEHVWEICDRNHNYYRINTFSLLWQKRQAYAHILMDITDERLKTRTLKDKAYHDALTGVYNRIYFEEYMEKILREKTNIVIGYLDLDCLKTVNDQYGHAEGDGYILQFVSIIQKHFRTSDILTRVGGDEFCLILEDIPKKVVVEKLDMAMKEFQSCKEKAYIHGFSYGVVEVRGQTDTRTLKQIIEEADAAMYECKRRNKELYKRQQRGDEG